MASKQELRERSLARLTDSAFRLFISRGYHATSLDAISAEAGLTKGAVYFYFKSKENLVLNLFDILREDMVAPLVSAISDGEGGLADRVVRYIHRGAEFGASQPERLLFMIQMAIEFGGQDNAIATGIRELYFEIYNALEIAAAKASKLNALPVDLEPREFASMVVAVHDGMMLEWHIRGADIDGAKLVRNVRHMLLHGIT